MNIIKKQGLGSFITIGTIIISIICLIIYGVTLSTGDNVQVANGGEMYLFKDEFGTVTTVGIISLFTLVVGLIIPNIKTNGTVNKVLNFVGDALRIIAPALIIYTFVYFLNGCLTGLGWTFFSNEELEINPVAIKAGHLTIVTLVFFLIAFVTSLVGAFFPILKKEEAAQETEEIILSH